MKKSKFTQVSYFSKIPILYRTSTFSIISALMILIIVLAYYKTTNEIRLTVILISIGGVILCFVKLYKLRVIYRNSPLIKLKKYILDNRLYEEEIRQVGTDSEGNPVRDMVVYNSAYYSYLQSAGELIVRAHKYADKFSDRADKQDSMLSALFGLEVYKKNNTVQYCDYIFETEKDKRLNINERITSNYQIQMTQKIGWKLGTPPHTIVTGATMSGKSFLVTMLILDYLRMGADIRIADPKSADLAIVGRYIDIEKFRKVTCTETTGDGICKLLREANEEMEKRYGLWFSDENSFGKTWKDIPEAKPLVVIIDEYSALISVSAPKLVKELNSYLFNLILKGRQAGIEVVLIMQRPDTNLLSGNLRDQFGVRILLGNATKDAQTMLFGSVDMDFKSISEIGSGYIMIDGKQNVPIYFEAPLLSKDSGDYLDNLDKAIKVNKSLQVTPYKE